LRLLNARVDGAGHVANLPQQRVPVREVGRQVVAANLQIDRRRRAEIQDLADDVRGRERERDTRKLAWKLLAHLLDIISGRAVSLAQCDLEVAVLRTDRSRVVVGRIDSAD
jgi:hypothetical protein